MLYLDTSTCSSVVHTPPAIHTHTTQCTISFDPNPSFQQRAMALLQAFCCYNCVAQWAAIIGGGGCLWHVAMLRIFIRAPPIPLTAPTIKSANKPYTANREARMTTGFCSAAARDKLIQGLLSCLSLTVCF